MGLRTSFWYITRKTYLGLYGLSNFHANPRKSAYLYLGYLQKWQTRRKIKNWPKNLPEYGLKTYFLVYDQENIFIFIWYYLINIVKSYPQTPSLAPPFLAEIGIREGLKKVWNFPYFNEVGGFEKVIFHKKGNKNHGLKIST